MCLQDRIIRLSIAWSIVQSVVSGTYGADIAPEFEPKPNVLFIAIDDLNDWVGCLGGHPQTSTPHIDALAARGMLFTNAHCAASLCNPSRASVLTGTLPSTNGVHGNQQDWRISPYLEGHHTLPEYFRNHGYWTGACGKIFHANHGGECGAMNGGHGGLRGFNHPPSWVEAFPSHDQQLARLPIPTGRNFNGLDIWHWDWGPIAVTDDATEDGQAVTWAESILSRDHEQPFFLAVGIYKPHGPWYCPPAYFGLHQHQTIELPHAPAEVLDDVPMIAHRSNLHRTIIDAGLYEEAVRAYLANISFADAMVGRLLRALDAGPAANDTIVVLWSDHGWHLGEKQHWHKGTNWEEGTRVPLIVAAPGLQRAGETCAEPVSLVDIYPTLLELCELPDYERLDGLSLGPQLTNPTTPRNRPAYTINNGRHQSVRSRQWRYIRYSDGSEELYNHDADPEEFHNLATEAEYHTLKTELAAWFPSEIRQAQFQNEPPYEDGFRLIFNGYDLNTWDGDQDVWRVEGEAIVGHGRRGQETARLAWTGGRLRDFELRMRCRATGEGSLTLSYRAVLPNPTANGEPAGDDRKECQLQLDFQESAGSEVWQDVSIIAHGLRHQHFVDGKLVAEFTADDPALSGDQFIIELQCEEGCRVELKDIRVRN